MKLTDTLEGPIVDYSAELLSKKIKREARLRATVEQSALNYYWGDSLLAVFLRIVGVLALGYLCFRNGVSTASGALLLMAIGGLAEAHRANRRLDAMIQLTKLTSENSHSEQDTASNP